MARRQASHAGSWYEARAQILDTQLEGWLASVQPDTVPEPPVSVIDVVDGHNVPSRRTGSGGSHAPPPPSLQMPVPGCKAVIAPHAGYSYSGPPAAWAYHCIDPAKYKRIFILGPSHHVYLDGCALSTCKSYETPIGDLPLDLGTIDELRKTGHFSRDMSISTDEDEHSIEMHLPYVRKIFQGRDITIVPILVGSISSAKEDKFGKLLAPYLADPESFFVVSSDFCHWGSRFSYTYYRPDPDSRAESLLASTKIAFSQPQIHASIRALDGTAISHLTYPAKLPVPHAGSFKDSTVKGALVEPPALVSSSEGNEGADGRTAADAQREFAAYLKETRNTICGRHPIGVLLGALSALEQQGTSTELRFTRYEQSSQCRSERDSSVSYASAFVRFLG